MIDSSALKGRPVLLAVAPNGARLRRTDHPALPMTPDELARTASACLEAGAAMIHLHVRDRHGAHVLDAELYRDAIRAVRSSVGTRMIVQITTEALGRYQQEHQIAVVAAVRPEAVSLA
ncbi:MAG: 3-keto-5-aminohexanoate cleavage protein, partial [Hyphomicrobiales bacterium]|nr:3-keto-5-aminohexanoate cleavage protein [Hyphomicrobiales bacterium]